LSPFCTRATSFWSILRSLMESGSHESDPGGTR
jgi:hypothetical protein